VQTQDYEKAAQLKEQTDKIQQTFVEAKNAWLATRASPTPRSTPTRHRPRS